MPETGPCAPARTLVAVRAIVPVTQMPPNSAEPMLAKPCATSSQLERCRRPVMPSATTAESSDSIAPSSVKAMASGSTACMAARSKAGSAGRGSERGMPPKRVPIVSTGSARTAAATEATATAISMPGQDGRQRFSPAMVAMVSRATSDRRRIERSPCRGQRPELRDQLARLLAVERQAEQLAELAGEDDDGDARGEADRHRIGDELDVGAEPQIADRQQEDARHHGGEDQPVDAVARNGRRHQHDEGAGRSADLEAAAAERRDEEAADDRRVEAAVGRHAGRDGDRHRQRQRDDRDRQPGDGVGLELLAARSPRAAR